MENVNKTKTLTERQLFNKINPWSEKQREENEDLYNEVEYSFEQLQELLRYYGNCMNTKDGSFNKITEEPKALSFTLSYYANIHDAHGNMKDSFGFDIPILIKKDILDCEKLCEDIKKKIIKGIKERIKSLKPAAFEYEYIPNEIMSYNQLSCSQIIIWSKNFVCLGTCPMNGGEGIGLDVLPKKIQQIN